MPTFLQYRDGGKSDEKGISTHLAGLFQGEVINGLAVSQGSPLGMTVNVSKGRCMIDSGDDYPYLGFTDAIETVTITTADGSNPRIDAIVGYVDLSVVDSTNANNPDAFLIVAVPGTPAGSPNAPNDGAVESAIGLGNPFIRLAHVTVGTGVTTITNGNITDTREMVTPQIADGAITPVKRSGGYKTGTITLTGTGSLAITGVGFTPKSIRFTYLPSTSTARAVSASGGSDGTNHYATCSAQASSSGATGSFTNRVLFQCNTSGTAQTIATLTSFDADGFTLNVTTYSSVYGGVWAYEAYA